MIYQKYWNVVMDKNIPFCLKSFQRSYMSHEFNSTLLLWLVPKCPNPSSLWNYNPIGLCKWNYMIMTKIIVNQLKINLPSINGPSQANFISNRRASDNAIIMKEYITHFGKMRGKDQTWSSRLILKKAFDRIELSYICDTLRHSPS